MRTLRNSKANPSKGTADDAQANAKARASDVAQATAGAADSPMGEDTTPLTFDERESAKRRIQ